ncbi:hypothetical protein FXO38_27529 [Capsicum annuum]|nr:hypothetical protein FXO38_27529 [Capsicum annuum]KAF3635220.1 hypothetical protein FXO37_26118 [Capsicum annuum]
MEGDPFKYKENNTKIVYPYLTPTVREMEQRYMIIFKPYTDKVKDTSIDALKAQLNGMTVLTSSAETQTKTKIWVTTIMFQIQHLLVIMLVQVDLKLRQTLLTTMTYARVLLCSREVYWILLFFVRDERLRRIKKNKKQQDKMHLDSPPRIRHKVNLKELAVAVTDIAAADKKVEEENKEEETEEENAADKHDAEEEEEEEGGGE